MTRTPRFNLERLVQKGDFKQLHELLKLKHRADPDPDARARQDIEQTLTRAFDHLAKHYSGSKDAALKALLRLQSRAMDFYQNVLGSAGNKADVAGLEKILRDMDEELKKLSRGAAEVAQAAPKLDVPAPAKQLDAPADAPPAGTQPAATGKPSPVGAKKRVSKKKQDQAPAQGTPDPQQTSAEVDPDAAAASGTPKPGDVTIELKPYQVERLTKAELAKKWTDLPGRIRTSLGKRYGYIVQRLVREIASGGRAKQVLHYVNVDADLIKKLREGGGRVVITEGKLKGGAIRFDIAEIDFDAKTIQVIDLTPSNRGEHVSKTKEYRDALQELTGFETDAIELHYVDADDKLVMDLLEFDVDE